MKKEMGKIRFLLRIFALFARAVLFRDSFEKIPPVCKKSLDSGMGACYNNQEQSSRTAVLTLRFRVRWVNTDGCRPVSGGFCGYGRQFMPALFCPRGVRGRESARKGATGYWRCFTISKKDSLINEEIREKEVRVIDADGSQLGILPTRQALAIAAEKGLDLVDIAPQATPHVCRIMDYNKYRYEQAKREKEARKNQKTVDVKEVRMSMNIDTHDFETKVNQAIKFLKGGDKVKVSVRFRGREMAHTDLGRALLDRFKDACSEVGVIDKPAKMEGRSMAMFISAKPSK